MHSLSVIHGNKIHELIFKWKWKSEPDLHSGNQNDFSYKILKLHIFAVITKYKKYLK